MALLLLLKRALSSPGLRCRKNSSRLFTSNGNEQIGIRQYTTPGSASTERQASRSVSSSSSTTYPLASLSSAALIRSLVITSVTSSPTLFRLTFPIFSRIASTTLPDTNALVHFLLKKSIYPQFCAGETPEEVQRTLETLSGMGLAGVALGAGREVETRDPRVSAVEEATKNDDTKLEEWRLLNLATIHLARASDFVALKFSGSGPKALKSLLRGDDVPPAALDNAITALCNAASRANVRLLFDAEQTAVQRAIDKWTMHYQRLYNSRHFSGRPREGDETDTLETAFVYGTYQAYLKSTPSTLARHLEIAKKYGFVLGVKLVRGAYLGTEPRYLIHPTKEDTDQTYDSIAESLIRRKWGPILKTPAGLQTEDFPDVNLVLAGHNIESVRKARRIREEQLCNGDARIGMCYAQLMGMADEVSGELVQVKLAIEQKHTSKLAAIRDEVPQTYKYVVWGTVGECMRYLVRRAEENKDAVLRTKESKKALWEELLRRVSERLQIQQQ